MLEYVVLVYSLVVTTTALNLGNATFDDTWGDQSYSSNKPIYIWVDNANWTSLEATTNDCNPYCSNDITQSQACWSCPPLGLDTASTVHFTNWVPVGKEEDTPENRARVELIFVGE